MVREADVAHDPGDLGERAIHEQAQRVRLYSARAAVISAPRSTEIERGEAG